MFSEGVPVRIRDFMMACSLAPEPMTRILTLASLPPEDNWLMGKKQIADDVGKLAIANGDVPMAVRYLLQLIENSSPGRAVELRVPPYGAIQCVQGLDHRRGTPPNVIEMTPEVFLSLCKGQSSWSSELEAGTVVASGALANEVARLFPVELEN